jgi:hypothetical protein
MSGNKSLTNNNAVCILITIKKELVMKKFLAVVVLAMLVLVPVSAQDTLKVSKSEITEGIESRKAQIMMLQGQIQMLQQMLEVVKPQPIAQADSVKTKAVKKK